MIPFLLLIGSIEFGINSGGDVPIDILEQFLDQGTFHALFEHSCSGVQNPYDGMYLWGRSDKRLSQLSALTCQGQPLRIYLEASYTPNWMSDWIDGIGMSGVPERLDWYADLCCAVVSRYSENGVYQLSNPIQGIGLWNEPDGIGIMKLEGPYPIPQAMVEYGLIAREAASAIRAIDTDIEIISGGFLSPAACLPLWSDEFTWRWEVYSRLQPVFSCVLPTPPPHPPFVRKDYDWDVNPDVLHWHPYFGHDYPSERFFDETWYDPLVLDVNEDNMFATRPQELPEFLESIFTDSPSWTDLKQYAMEYCPTYGQPDWLVYPPDWDEFYTRWRANYFITANIMLFQTGDMDLICPYPACNDHWWWSIPESGEDNGWYQVDYPYEGLEPNADIAYIHQSNMLSGKTCEYLDPMEIPGYNGEVHVWRYTPDSDLLPTTFALRTARMTEEDLTFDYEQDHTVFLPVPPGAVSGVHTDIDGTVLNGNVQISAQTATLQIDGYVSYLELLYSDEDSENASIESAPEWLVERNSVRVSIPICDENVVSMRVLDMAGRSVFETDGYQSDRYRVFRWNWTEESAPAGVYFAILVGNDHVVSSRKVVVVR